MIAPPSNSPPGINIAFWNIKKMESMDTQMSGIADVPVDLVHENNDMDSRRIDMVSVLVDLVHENQVSILCLCESDIVTISDFIWKYNGHYPHNKFELIELNECNISILSSLDKKHFEDVAPALGTPRWLSYKVNIPSIIEFNLFVVHLESKVHWSESSLTFECVKLSQNIDRIENRVSSCENSILVGDFNINPFEHGMVAAMGLNAVSDLNYAASAKKRNFHEVDYKFFYNPMWNFFGDFRKPPGTYYKRVSEHVSHEWHILDQVLLRPCLKKYLNPLQDSVKIVTMIANTDLTAGKYLRPNDSKYSDHYPILLTLTI